MGVVVEDPDPARGALELEAPARPGEPGQPLPQVGAREAQCQPRRQRGRGVEGVVAPGDAQLHRP